ncbi:hypothetical protein [Bartonella saheliensis]|uniref:hypothetical protein n=1 Tax=Bartonella saheliensis TaxID=1457016 RepID=UPI001AA06476|nr:hypothetical protein [Bartonella saheliensis]
MSQKFIMILSNAEMLFKKTQSQVNKHENSKAEEKAKKQSEKQQNSNETIGKDISRNILSVPEICRHGVQKLKTQNRI